MKRRNFLKAIGIGAVIAPAVVKAATENEGYIDEVEFTPYPKYTPNLWIMPNQTPHVHTFSTRLVDPNDPHGPEEVCHSHELWPSLKEYWERETGIKL